MRLTRFGLPVMMVVPGLLVETGDLHACRSVEPTHDAQQEAGRSGTLRADSAHQCSLALTAETARPDGAVAVVVEPAVLRPSNVAAACHVEPVVAASRAAEGAHRPRGPPIPSAT